LGEKSRGEEEHKLGCFVSLGAEVKRENSKARYSRKKKKYGSKRKKGEKRKK